MSRYNHTVAIFCGGQSRRMGQHKSGVILSNGLTMLEHVVNIAKNFTPKIVLVGHAQGIAKSLNDIPLIEDNYKDCGPLGGLEALLKTERDTEYLVLSCDLIHLNNSILELLIQSKTIPTVLSTSEKIQPLVARYPQSIYSHVRKQLENDFLSMHSLLKKINPSVIRVPLELESYLHNVNSPMDVSY